jgi:tRNA threonylcarbamoyladenosine biosynthesis protein TsaE
MDAYRLESETEAAELDLDRMLSEGALVIEWPERVNSVVPSDQLRILVDYVGDEQRRLQFEAKGARYDRVLQEVQHALFGVV